MNEITGDLVLKMPLAIINGIAESLCNYVSAVEPIYINNVEALDKNKENCFYIKGPLTVIEKNYLQERVRLRLLFDVSFHFAEKTTDMMKKATIPIAMRGCLRQIQPCLMIDEQMTNIGPTKAGFDINTEIVDDDIHVTVGYDVWLDRAFKKQFVQSLSINFN